MTGLIPSLRICIVEDDPLMLEVFTNAVEGLGHHAMPTPTADVAIEVVSHSRVDVVLIDILLPDRDGLDLILAVRGVVPKLRIIAMSGGGSIGANALLTMASGLGADAMLAKPFSTSDLSRALAGSEAASV